MSKGQKARVIITYDDAYGDTGIPQSYPFENRRGCACASDDWGRGCKSYLLEYLNVFLDYNW